MNELYLKLLTRAISDHPETSAALLIPHVKTLQEEREHLLIQILQQPLTFNSVAELIHALEKEDILLDQREELLKYILSKPVSDEILQEIIEVYYSGSLSEEQRGYLFSGILSRLQSEEILRIPELLKIYPMTQEQKERFAQLAFNQVNQTEETNLGELIQSVPLTIEQRLELIGALLSDNPQEDFVGISNNHKEYLKEIQRDKLWGILMNYSPDRERRKQIFDFLLQYPVEREQREKLWQKLLEISADDEHRDRLLAILKKCKPEKEQRDILWQKLLEISPDKEHRQRLLDLLDKCSLEREHQDKLWTVLLDYPPEREHRKQMVDVLIQYPLEKEERVKIWNVLAEYPTNPEQVSRFSKQLFTYISKGTLPTELQTLQKMAEYRRLYKQLYPWANPETDRWKAGQASAYERIVEQNDSISDVLLDMICGENICYLKGAEMEFLDRKQLWIMIEELLLQESYAFPIDNDSPCIIDCGVNIGLAIYYMKQRWPNAQIIGFEPWDKAYECAIRNIERNHWKNIDIHHAALSSIKGSQELIVIQENSTAATLTHRMDQLLSKEVFTSINQTVQTETLSRYLTKPVDLLKMDIEGMEGPVLEEAKKQLDNVQYLFCEYHYSEDSKENSLAAILSLLENKGFSYQTDRSLSYQQLRTQPGMYLGRNSSTCIWAYNQTITELKDERKA